MVGRKKDKSQIDRGRTDLHPDGIREIAGSSFRIRLARECRRELKRGRSSRAERMNRHGMNISFPSRR